MSVDDHMERLDKFTRTIKMASTYLRKAQGWLYRDPPNLVEYWGLLDATLDVALDIVKMLPDDFFETTTSRSVFDGQPFKHNLSDDPLEAARKVLSAIEKRRGEVRAIELINRLEDTAGRTIVEAESFRAKARELRSRVAK